jgi:hypothetical protein
VSFAYPRSGEVTPTASSVHDLYYAAFRTRVFQLLAWGYADARPLVNAVSKEPEITGYIAEAIDDRINDPATDECYGRFVVRDDPPVRTPGRAGTARRRADLVLQDTTDRPQRKYVFEGKRLGQGNPISRYVGADGLQLFVDEQYARECGEAAMLGYMQSHDAQHWFRQLKSALRKRNGALRILDHPRACTINPSLPNVWDTVHGRSSGKSIKLSHVLLDCT